MEEQALSLLEMENLLVTEFKFRPDSAHQHAQSLIDKGIDTQSLLLALTEDELKELGITQKGELVKIRL